MSNPIVRSRPLGGVASTLLIVDDDASLRAALESVLAGQGYRVRTAADGDSAYALLTSEPADAILLDVQLPGISGLALYLAIVHRWPQYVGRIAFMTADADAPDVRLWLEHGRHTALRKPFSVDALTAWLASVLRAPGRVAAPRRA